MRRLLVMLVCVCAATTASAQPVIQRWTVRDDGSKGCPGTWSGGPREGQWYRFDVLPGASPTGTAALRVTGIPTAEVGDVGWGCTMAPEPVALPAGTVRYVRARLRYQTPMVWQSDNRTGQVALNNRTPPDKFFILGNLSGDSSRVIWHQYAAPPGRTEPFIRVTQGTGSSAPAAWVPVPTDRWINVQARIVSGDRGSICVYLDSNDEAAPTACERDINIGTRGWSTATCPTCHWGFGDFSFNAPSNRNPATRVVYDLADMELGTTFDPQWHVGGGAPPPTGPTIRLDCAHIESITRTTDAGGYQRWIVRGTCTALTAGVVRGPGQE